MTLSVPPPAHSAVVESDPLWTGAALVSAMDAKAHGAVPEAITGVSIDSRSIAPGEVYFAIRGDVHDGHDFVLSAWEKGASLAVVDEAHASVFEGRGPLAIAPDVLRGLEAAGMARRAALDAGVIAVTGSVGKTGTKEALRLVLSRQGATHAPVASFNNHWGVPLTLARTPESVRYAIYEIGMSNPGEIAPLARMAAPDVAIITTVQPVHLASFPSVDAIADEKSAIFEGLKPGGIAIVNADLPQTARMRSHAMASKAGRVISFGADASADVRLVNCALKADMSTVEASVLGQPVTYRIGSPGRHVVINSLAILAAVKAVGADLALAALALGDLRPPSGRGAHQALHAPGGNFTLIDESYNANPASVRAALENLGRMPVEGRARRIAVLGDMLELGPTGPELHAGLKDAILANGVHRVFACGPLMRGLYDSLPPALRGAYAANASGLEGLVLEDIHAGDVVTVKGSLGSRMGGVVKAIVARFPATLADD
jgi:UDP-N-acetylmuramoyl-tripeptide--D-alanyl-D-alanine ligase